MTDENPRTEELRRLAYARAYELIQELHQSPTGLAYDNLLNIVVLAWLDGYEKMADWTRAELDATAERLATAIAELGR
jgi:phage-related tail protein